MCLTWLRVWFAYSAVYGEGLNEEQRMGGPASTGCTQANLTGPTLVLSLPLSLSSFCPFPFPFVFHYIFQS